jgi:hypothetical protein
MIMFAVILGIHGLLVILGSVYPHSGDEWITLKSLGRGGLAALGNRAGSSGRLHRISVQRFVRMEFRRCRGRLLMWLTVGLSMAPAASGVRPVEHVFPQFALAPVLSGRRQNYPSLSGA